MTKPETEKLLERLAAMADALRNQAPVQRSEFRPSYVGAVSTEFNDIAGLLDDALAAIRAQGGGATPDAAPDAVCHWSMTDDVYEGETWNSDCGVKYCFIEGGPADNGHQFCHCCGKALIAHARSAGGEDGNR